MSVQSKVSVKYLEIEAEVSTVIKQCISMEEDENGNDKVNLAKSMDKTKQSINNQLISGSSSGNIWTGCCFLSFIIPFIVLMIDMDPLISQKINQFSFLLSFIFGVLIIYSRHMKTVPNTILDHERKIVLSWLNTVYLSLDSLSDEWLWENRDSIRILVISCTMLERFHIRKTTGNIPLVNHLPMCLPYLWDLLKIKKKKLDDISPKFDNMVKKNGDLFQYFYKK